LHDPVTGKPSERVRGRVEHENPRWKFDLNKVSAEDVARHRSAAGEASLHCGQHRLDARDT